MRPERSPAVSDAATGPSGRDVCVVRDVGLKPYALRDGCSLRLSSRPAMTANALEATHAGDSKPRPKYINSLGRSAAAVTIPNAKYMLEIGTWKGGSARAIRIASRNRKPKKTKRSENTTTSPLGEWVGYFPMMVFPIPKMSRTQQTPEAQAATKAATLCGACGFSFGTPMNENVLI